jgi:hypothetical protein
LWGFKTEFMCTLVYNSYPKLSPFYFTSILKIRGLSGFKPICKVMGMSIPISKKDFYGKKSPPGMQGSPTGIN